MTGLSLFVESPEQTTFIKKPFVANVFQVELWVLALHYYQGLKQGLFRLTGLPFQSSEVVFYALFMAFLKRVGFGDIDS